MNCADADVEKYLGIYTFLPMKEVRRLGRLQDADLRQAKEVLAFEATALTHGRLGQARKAQETSRALFRGEAGLLDAMLTTSVTAAELEAGITLADLLVKTGLYQSRGLHAIGSRPAGPPSTVRR